MAPRISLRCRECAGVFEPLALHVCDFCFGPLEASYDYDEIASKVSRASIEAGPRSMWRYRELLPVGDVTPIDLGAGYTPLVKAERLGKVLGLDNLWVKNDTANPTGSFKDRVELRILFGKRISCNSMMFQKFMCFHRTLPNMNFWAIGKPTERLFRNQPLSRC